MMIFHPYARCALAARCYYCYGTHVYGLFLLAHNINHENIYTLRNHSIWRSSLSAHCALPPCLPGAAAHRDDTRGPITAKPSILIPKQHIYPYNNLHMLFIIAATPIIKPGATTTPIISTERNYN